MDRVSCIYSGYARLTQLVYLSACIFAVSNVLCADANPASCEGITEGYGCTCNVTDGQLSVTCDNSRLTSVPKNLTDPYRMTFTNNDFEVLDKLDYPNLVHLHLSGNKIRYIQEGAFLKLGHLEYLDLSDNLISGLHIGTFTGLSSLKTLVLSNNPLQAIPENTFLKADLPALSVLSMKYCQLHHIEDNAFDNLSVLRILSVTGNALVYLPKFGPGLTNLTSLDFSHNRIQRVEENAFQTLTALDVIQLSHNKYSALSGQVFNGLSLSLQHLYMREAVITWIDKKVFENLTKLQTLDITFNMITKLEGDRMPWASLQKVLLHDNPWECSCDNSWLVTQPMVKEYNKNVNDTNMRCSYPQSLKDTDLYTLEESALKPCDQQGPHHLSIAAGFIIAIVVIASIVAAIFIVRRIIIKKKRGEAIRSNSVYRQMEDDSARFEI